MLTVPTQAVASQALSVILKDQQVRISLRQLNTGLYMDLQSNGAEVVGLVICQNLNRIVRNAYLGFEGDFAWLDTTGAGADPFYTGLGSRFQLIYLEPTDLPGEG